MDENKINFKMAMIKSFGEQKYSPGLGIGTPKKNPKLAKDEILFGSTVIWKEDILTIKSSFCCGFCTAKAWFENRGNLKAGKDRDLSFKIAEDSISEVDKHDPIYFATSRVINANLERKYLTSRTYYNVKVINDIIYNECSNIVSMFKDYLIYDDVSEFLKRFYT